MAKRNCSYHPNNYNRNSKPTANLAKQQHVNQSMIKNNKCKKQLSKTLCKQQIYFQEPKLAFPRPKSRVQANYAPVTAYRLHKPKTSANIPKSHPFNQNVSCAGKINLGQGKRFKSVPNDICISPKAV